MSTLRLDVLLFIVALLFSSMSDDGRAGVICSGSFRSMFFSHFMFVICVIPSVLSLFILFTGHGFWLTMSHFLCLESLDIHTCSMSVCTSLHDLIILLRSTYMRTASFFFFFLLPSIESTGDFHGC